ncbi:MAG: putative membrane protein YgcG [Pseudoalteromonas tetraodonis]|jgi:uncharacterized membrane protein YgcG
MFKPDPIEAAPSSLVLDKARLFNEREAEQLSARLKEFGAEHNIVIYIAAYSVLIGENIEERASQLKDSWLKDKRGIVLVYQRGTERMTFSSTADPESYVKRSGLQHIFAAAYAKAAPQDRGSGRVIAAADQLMTDLPRAIEEQANSNAATRSETQSFVAWALAGLVLLAAAGMYFFQFLRKAQVQVTKSYSFPPMQVRERFGAPYCGGHQAEIQFTAPAD